MTFKEWGDSTNYFNYRDHNIAYWSAGQGTHLLLIHGFPTSSWDWHKLWKPLTARFTVVAVDMIGFGYSDKPKQYTYSITDQANLHETILKQLNIVTAHLLVHDYGVSVAQEMLASAKERKGDGFQPLSCCFLNGGLFPDLHHARPIQKILNSPVGWFFNQFLNKKSLRRSFHRIYGNQKPTDKELDQFYQLMLHKDGKGITYKLMRYITDRKENANKWKSALVDATIPLHFINGPLDPVSGRHLANYCRKLLPQWKVDILEGVGHYPHDEAPVEVVAAYFSFMNNM